MALFDWNDNYSVKVLQMDNEHKKLVGMLNELHESMKVGKGKEALESILDGLIKYTSTHFVSEEKLMKMHNYPGYEQQKKEHNILLLQVSDIQKKYKEGSVLLTQEVMLFLKDWLQKHIQIEDKKYGPFLNNKGVL
jgi:hemerythrin